MFLSDFFHEYRNVNDLSNADSHGYGSIDLGLGGSYSSSYGSASCLTIDICLVCTFFGCSRRCSYNQKKDAKYQAPTTFFNTFSPFWL